jgi:uncharacterized protein
MEQGELDSNGLTESPRHWRWWFHLLWLMFYPIALGIILPLFLTPSRGTLLPESTRGLLVVSALELMLFGIVFLLAWLASRATKDQLLLRWRGGIRPIWRGLIGSVALRVGVAAAVMLLAMVAALIGGHATDILQKLRPRTEVVVDAQGLQSSAIYFVLLLTLISFVVAGLREELWRAGVLAGLRELWPERFGSRIGQYLAVGIAAVVFGLGHMPQGWGGTAVTALLGFGLGMIMVRYQSIWEAVFAHGFFNATTFVLLYWLARFHPGLIPGQTP